MIEVKMNYGRITTDGSVDMTRTDRGTEIVKITDRSKEIWLPKELVRVIRDEYCVLYKAPYRKKKEKKRR